jgi:DNA modification methylase
MKSEQHLVDSAPREESGAPGQPFVARVEVWPVTRLRALDRNPRLHSTEQVARIAESIAQFGFLAPAIVDEKRGVVLAGNGRLAAAVSLGLSEIPVVPVGHLSEAQQKAYVIADNRIGLDATWDNETLAQYFAEIEALGLDVASSTFFSEAEIDAIIAEFEDENAMADEVEAPLPPEDPVTRAGDLWALGDHRLLCGDAGNAEDVDRLLAGAPIHLANCDPPYNVNVEPRSNNARAAGSTALPAITKGKAHLQGFDDARTGQVKPTTARMRPKDRVLDNDFMSDEEFDAMLRTWFGNIARVLLPGRAFYLWGGYANWANYCDALSVCGLRFAQGITWVKHHPVLGRKDFMNDCEHAWYGWREGAGHKWFGPNNATNVWEVRKVNHQSMVHLTQKPIELATRAMIYSSRRGENVLDLFGGSGSTLIGAEETGRHAYLMELDAAYCDVIVQRWQEATGKAAVLEGTERTFADVALERTGTSERE